MGDAGMSLVLGFIGQEPVHRDNVRSLLADLITAYKRDNRTAKIRFLLPTEPFGETMSDLADYCSTSGHQVGFVGPSGSFSGENIASYRAEAEGNLYPLGAGTSLAKGMISALSVWDDARLILIADPANDDDAYTALVTAAGMGIKVRSLLHGLDEVLMEPPEEEQPDMHVVEDEEFEPEVDEETGEELEEEPIDDEADEEGSPDLDALAAAADDDQDEAAQVELSELAAEAGINPDDYATWAEVAQLLAAEEPAAEEEDEEGEEEPEVEEDEEVEGAEDEEGFFDTDLTAEVEEDEEDLAEDSEEEEEPEEEEGVEDVDASDEEEEDEESESEEERETVPARSAAKKWTEASLNKLGDRNKEEFYEVCAEYGVYPGRGQKVSIMARKVMDEINGDAPATKRAPAKKAAAKKAAPAKRAASAKKAPAAKKATAAKKAPAAPRAAAVSSNSSVNKPLLRAALKASRAFNELAESLL